MTDVEAPIAIEEAIVPPASNGSAVSARKGDRKLSVVSKQYDVSIIILLLWLRWVRYYVGLDWYNAVSVFNAISIGY